VRITQSGVYPTLCSDTSCLGQVLEYTRAREGRLTCSASHFPLFRLRGSLIVWKAERANGGENNYGIETQKSLATRKELRKETSDSNNRRRKLSAPTLP